VKVLVTGAGGFIGGYLIQRLLGAGHEVRGLALDEADAERIRRAGDAEVLFGDVTKAGGLRPAAEGVDVVFHAAARVSDWGPWRAFEELTVRGTENMLAAAIDAGVSRFLLFSSTAVYEPMRPGSPPLTEDAPYGGPDSPWGYYGQAKIMAERALLRAQEEGRIAATIVRPVSIYGPGDRVFIPRIVQFLRRPTATWIGDRNPYTPFLFVSDAADAIAAAGTSDKAAGQTYTLGPDPEIRMRDFLLAICRSLDIRPPRLTVPYFLAAALANLSDRGARLIRTKEPPSLTRMSIFLMTQDQRFDISKAKRDLDWQPKVSMEEGVRQATEWARAQGLA
jgi:nucleoside-diphosphate-sugar epimerase